MSEAKPELLANENSTFICEERKRWAFFALPFTSTLYRFNEETLTVQRGLLTIRMNHIPLHRIMDTTLQASPFQKLFKVASLRVASTDQTLPELVIKSIRNAADFKAQLDEQIAKAHQQMDEA